MRPEFVYRFYCYVYGGLLEPPAIAQELDDDLCFAQVDQVELAHSG